MRKATLPVLLVAAVALGACSNMSNTEQRVGSGAAIGAGTGALLGQSVGGALLGGAVGAGAGYLIDKSEKGDL